MLEYCGTTIPQRLISDLKSLANRLESVGNIRSSLQDQTSEKEMQALIQRLERMIKDPILPMLDAYRNVPWPFV